MRTIDLDGEHLTFEDLADAACGSLRLRLAPAARERVTACREALESLTRSGSAVYGFNTGFGLLSEVRIDDADVDRLQENLIRSHCAGVGEPLPVETVRVMMLLRANVLARGHSAVRVDLLESLLAMFNADVMPVIPSRGSVGASGDLAPLAHLALGLMGDGEAIHRGRRTAAADALAGAGLKPVRLASREGLALVNGTQAMTAIGARALDAAGLLMIGADIAGAMTLEGLLGSARPFDERIAALRPHPGHAIVASNIRLLLEGSGIMDSHRTCGRVQDAYSLRCMPQVHGAARDALSYVRRVLGIEINAVTDNPLFFAEGAEALPGGNFHGQPVSQAMDLLGIAVADAGSISERRTERMVNPALSGLPAFLAPSPGLESGFMMAQVTAAALVSENKKLAHPSSVDSIPTGAGKEDHVSMGVAAAHSAATIVEHHESILAIEMMVAAQAIELRRPLRSSPALEAVHAALRQRVPALQRDRVLSTDIAAIGSMLRDGTLRRAAESITGPLG